MIDKILETPLIDRHSFFQLKYFVIGKEPTIQAKLWRCIRELKSRIDNIESMTLELEDLKDKKILLEESPVDTFGADKVKEAHSRMKQRSLKSLENNIKSIENKIKYTKEESDFFSSSYESLIKIEPLKPFDDLDAQTEYWNEKLSQEIDMRLLLSQPLDIELIKTVLCLNNGCKVKEKTIGMLSLINKKKLEA